jgi:hypothetical protein
LVGSACSRFKSHSNLALASQNRQAQPAQTRQEGVFHALTVEDYLIFFGLAVLISDALVAAWAFDLGIRSACRSRGCAQAYFAAKTIAPRRATGISSGGSA